MRIEAIDLLKAFPDRRNGSGLALNIKGANQMNKQQKAEQETRRTESIAYLKSVLKPGALVTTILKHVSNSGMSRRISLAVPLKDKRTKRLYIQNLDWYASNVLGYKVHERGGLVVGGCGMDMGFHVVYSLARALWPNGDGKYITNRNGDTKPDTDGGYLLTHTWL